MALQELKERPINQLVQKRMEQTMELSEHNISVYRKRMDTILGIKSNIYSLTHNGNEPKSNEQLLDDARMYIEKNVYTDEQWEQYFITAINEMIAYNDNFVQWLPGYLIREKRTGKLAIVKNDYSTAYGGRDYTSLSICELDNNGNINHCWSWADYDKYELVDDSHMKENMKKIKLYYEKYW